MSRIGSIENIERYIRAHAATHATRDHAESPLTASRPFMTISRQAGSGAHDLADTIVDVFSRKDDADTFHGWQIYDRTICEIVAEDPMFAGSLDSLIEEEYRTKTNDFFHQMLVATADQNMVMERVFLVVRAVAGMGRAIIIGRGGAHVTAGMAHRVAIRLVAPQEQRVAKVMASRGLDEREARSDISKRDADRARMVKRHFNADIQDPLGYDATWNVASTTYEEIADAVADLVRHRVGPR
jgi:cytidylate kinase